MRVSGKIPVTVLSGFLGSGKTSLLGRALRQGALRNTAVIVNEFGKIGLDHHLLSRVEERTVLLGGGCVCCSTREDLVAAFLELLRRASQDGRPDRVVIETTGLADPSPIWFTVLRHPVLQHHFDVERIVVTVDAVNGLLHLDRHAESVKQAAVADLIVLTKTDIASEASVRRLESRLRAINPAAAMMRTRPDDPDAPDLFPADRPLHAPSRALSEPSAPDRPSPHDGGTRSLSVRFDRPLDWNAFGLWLSMLLHARGVDILRVKGHLDLGGDGPVLLNGVQHIIHPPEHLEGWPNGERCSKIVFIMKGIEPQQVMDSLTAFQHVLGAAPERLADAEFAV